MFNEDAFGVGKIVYNEFDRGIIENFTPDSDLLSEDMLQVQYPNEILLDIGWHFGLKGFLITTVENLSWENPIEKRLCKDMNSLERNLYECLGNIERILREAM